MQAITKCLVLIVTTLLLLFGTSIHAQPSPTGPFLIRPFGDSITYGYGFADNTFCPVYAAGQAQCGVPEMAGGGYRGWMTGIVLALAASKIQPPFTFMTEGHQNGGSYLQQWQTATQAHDGYPGFRTDQLLPIAAYPSFADITLVHAGTNDIFQGKNIEDTANNLFTILQTLLLNGTRTHVYVAQIIAFSPSFTACKINGTACNTLVTQYNQLIPQKVRLLPPSRVTVVDMSKLLNSDDYLLDGIHPNASGYIKMACAWIGAINAANTPPNCSSLSQSAQPELSQQQQETMLRTLPATP